MIQFRLDRPARQPSPAATDAIVVNAPLADGPSQLTTEVADSLPAAAEPTHLLHFEPLGANGAGLDIPCDPQGRVGLDALGDKVRNDYFFARALIGRLFARPTVRAALPLMHA